MSENLNKDERFSFESEDVSGFKMEYVDCSLEEAKQRFVKDKTKAPNAGRFSATPSIIDKTRNPHVSVT